MGASKTQSLDVSCEIAFPPRDLEGERINENPSPLPPPPQCCGDAQSHWRRSSQGGRASDANRSWSTLSRGGGGGKRFSFIFSLDGCGDRLKCGVWRFAGAFVVPEGFSCLRCSRPWPARLSLLHTLRSSLAMPAQLTPKEKRSVDAIVRVQRRSVADAWKTVKCSAAGILVRSAVRHGVTPLRNLSDAYQTRIRHLSDTYQTPIRHL